MNTTTTPTTAQPHTFKQLKAAREFAEDVVDFGGMVLGGMANRKQATEFRTKHIRSGKLSRKWTTDSTWKDKLVLAVAYCPGDGTVFVLTADLMRIVL
jgi:hypothetical protein